MIKPQFKGSVSSGLLLVFFCKGPHASDSMTLAAPARASIKPVQILVMAFKINPVNQQPHKGDQDCAK